MNFLNTDIGIRTFQEIVNSKTYVDKSLLIKKVSEYIGTESKYLCLTRPRRFGKTINANMLGAYYTKGYDSDKLFADFKIACTQEYRDHLNQHNVIQIDFSRMPDFCTSYQEYLESILKMLKSDLAEAYSQTRGKAYDRISQMLWETGDSFIFILDEWDSIFHEEFVNTRDKVHFLKFLRGLLKDQPYVELAYMTGVLPIAKYSSGSELNMFDEFNFMNDNIFDHFFGFSEGEVKELCEKNEGITFDELKRWYDGYYTSDGKSLFNPRSVTKALNRKLCLNYWTETGPMNEIADCIENNVDEVREDIVKMVSGISVEEDLHGYSALDLELNTRDEILSAMVVYGFLSYYDGHLSIPNHELMEKFQRVLSRDSMGGVKEIVDRSREMLEATIKCDEKKVASMIEYVHDQEIPFLQYGDENSLSCVITLCYLYARKDYDIEREAKSGKGYCDYLFRPRKSGLPAIILELKSGGTCEEAIRQIKDRNYLQKTEKYQEILLVGIAYSRKKEHVCMIERCTNN
ncbi:ATP-binding protein [Faecalicatena sp. AGMB00832]|uniref:ATP-binding protein n=1 Tax=Faecalicatena faecalis TaxID=2726362 RepID=A0ABS6D0V8_9FIRM|nr:AAA family ATPase [Faecalicatena faecalis]MBU3874871.1 ATP-binding protein [Faecalicatena faecalis]